MSRNPEPGFFKPVASRIEAKSDATTRAAREIINHEANARIAKTAKLREARLALEASLPTEAVDKAPRRKKSAPAK